MNERIKALCELTLTGKMFAEQTPTKYDEADLLLPKHEMQSKRISEYILNQEPVLTEYSAMTGFFNFDASVVGDAFRRYGYAGTRKANMLFYRKITDGLSAMEWQHATADYTKILKKGCRDIVSNSLLSDYFTRNQSIVRPRRPLLSSEPRTCRMSPSTSIEQ